MLGILSIILLSIISCNSDESEGKWDDNIKLSEKEIAINAELNSFLITTEGTSWWINEIGLNNDWNFDLSGIDTT
jgi:hypothetical protein